MNAGHKIDASPRWETSGALRSVLVVVRNATSLDRLTDLLPLFATDDRIDVQFTVEKSSSVSWLIEKNLESMGIRVVSWERAVACEYALILATDANQHLSQLVGPKMLVPHGVGYNRTVIENIRTEAAIGGTPEWELTCDGGVIPQVIGISHESQIEQIKQACPAAVDRIRLIGDPSFDRIMASLVHRNEYRRALQVDENRRLVVVTSTWGQHSLLGTQQDFVHKLVAQLPIDEYQVALVLHPNIWHTHSVYQLKQQFRDAADSGMLLVPPNLGWRAALIAADSVLENHGSVTFYGAALGSPTAQQADGLEGLDPDSALAMFSRTVVRLDPWGDMHSQLEALARERNAASMEHVVHQAVRAPGRSWKILHEAIYEVLDLPSPVPIPRMLPIPMPEPVYGDITTSFIISASSDPQKDVVSLARFPGLLGARFGWLSDQRDFFRVVENREIDPFARLNADVLVNAEPQSEADAAAWAKRTVQGNTGAQIAAAATEYGYTIQTRGGHRGHGKLTRIRPTYPAADDILIAAAALYAWWADGQQLPNGVLKLKVAMGTQNFNLIFNGT